MLVNAKFEKWFHDNIFDKEDNLLQLKDMIEQLAETKLNAHDTQKQFEDYIKKCFQNASSKKGFSRRMVSMSEDGNN